jgi:hypothetical protein
VIFVLVVCVVLVVHVVLIICAVLVVHVVPIVCVVLVVRVVLVAVIRGREIVPKRKIGFFFPEGDE